MGGAPLRQATVAVMSDEMAKVIQLFREDPQLAAQEKLISVWERAFARFGQSLTDPVAADSLRAAVGVMSVLLDGACATGLINEEQRDRLRSIVQGGLLAADEFQGLP